MESNTLIEQLKAKADLEGNVTIRFQYPNDWDKVKSFKDGDVRSMHYDLAAIFVSKGIASMNLESKEAQQVETPVEPIETKSTNKKKKDK